MSIDFEYTGAAVDPFQNHRVGFEGTVTVNRKDWGINWNAALEAGGVLLVSEKVALEFEIAAVKNRLNPKPGRAGRRIPLGAAAPRVSDAQVPRDEIENTIVSLKV